MLNDTQILDWLEKNCVYFEHGDRTDESSYWPHKETDCAPVEAFAGLSIREYVETRAALE